jgi:hypothetical protein
VTCVVEGQHKGTPMEMNETTNTNETMDEAEANKWWDDQA